MLSRPAALAVLPLLLAAVLPAGAQTWPFSDFQKPREIRQMAAAVRAPKSVHVPKGAQALRTVATSRCERRISLVADALFDFGKSTLRPDAERTLMAAAPAVRKIGGKPAHIEGHTDARGSDAASMTLSEARAAAVRDWMAKHDLIPAGTPAKGFGKSAPIASNTTPDGHDDPLGRQKNRRVEMVFDTCA